ncbi:MAG: hypothetical protein ACM3X6_07880 [Patescibacteria group bacterium]
MDEGWHQGALAEFGLEAGWVTGLEPDRVEVDLGPYRGCLWRIPALTRDVQELFMAWEDYLAKRRMCAAHLLAKGGAAFVGLPERGQAILTAWDGEDQPKLESVEDLTRVARFLARFRRAAVEAGLPAPPVPGLGWLAACRERCRRLQLFCQLATERLNPTQFDLVYLEHANYYRRQAERATEELGRALEGLEEGPALIKMDRHRVYRVPGTPGLALKLAICLGNGHQIRDLSRFLARVLPRLSWTAEPAAAVLAAYNGEWPLSAREMRALQAGLGFPNDYYRLAYHYFFNRKSWPLRTFLRKYEHLLQLEAERQRLLAELPLLLP